jgi:hypothetical protein
MCRIWLDGVPAGRQPAPTDCASALRNRPANGQVIFGDDFARPDSARGGAESRADGAPLKGLAPLPRALDPRAGDSGQGKKPDEAKRKAEHGKPAAHKPDTTATDPSGQVTGLLR